MCGGVCCGLRLTAGLGPGSGRCAGAGAGGGAQLCALGARSQTFLYWFRTSLQTLAASCFLLYESQIYCAKHESQPTFFPPLKTERAKVKREGHVHVRVLTFVVCLCCFCCCWDLWEALKSAAAPAASASAPRRNAQPTLSGAALFDGASAVSRTPPDDGRGAGKIPPCPSTFSEFLQLSEAEKMKAAAGRGRVACGGHLVRRFHQHRGQRVSEHQDAAAARQHGCARFCSIKHQKRCD